MPHLLIEEQKRIISGSTQHLLDFTPEKIALISEIEQLKEALEQESLPESHPYAVVQKCYWQPTSYFRRLEDLNSNITIGCARRYFLEFMTEEIQKAAAAAQTSLQELHWNIQEYFNYSQQAPDNANPFVSAGMAFDVGEHPWQIPVDPTKIYRAAFVQDQDFRCLRTNIFIDAPEIKDVEGDIIFYPDHIVSDEDENAFIEDQKSLAAKSVETTVIKLVFKYLLDTQIITAEQKEKASLWAQQLLIHRFYFNAVLDQSLPFDSFIQIGPNQKEFLSAAGIISLIKAKKLTLAEAKNITEHELLIINTPFYLNGILNDKIALETIKGCSRHQSRMLTLPTVIYLQTHNKLSLHEALHIAPKLNCILKSQHCIHMLMQDKISFQELKKLNHNTLRLLSEPYYCNQFFLGNIKLSKISLFSNRSIGNLRTKGFISLQKNNILSIKEAARMPFEAREIVDDSFYQGLILRNGLDKAELKNITPYQAETLMHPKIKPLIQEGVLPLQEALNIHDETRQILMKDRIQQLLLSKTISLTEAKKLSPHFAKFIEDHVIFYNLLRQGAFSLSDVMKIANNRPLPSSPDLQWGFIFGCRLIGLYKNKAQLPLAQVSAFETLQSDLDDIKTKQHLPSLNAILVKALNTFIAFLEIDIIDETQAPGIKNSFYADFLNNVAFNRFDAPDALSILHRLLKSSKKQIEDFPENSARFSSKRRRLSFSLFQPRRDAPNPDTINCFYNNIEQVILLAQHFGFQEEENEEAYSYKASAR